MTKVYCDISGFTKTNADGVPVDCIRATCPLCGNSEWAWGKHGGSVKAALAQLSESCPEDENNLYVEGGK